MIPRSLHYIVLFCSAALLVAIPACDKAEDPVFVEAEMAWRQARDQNMRQPDSWLTIAGLYWLEEGDNTFGTGEGNAVRLPEGSAPESAGRFILKNSKVRLVSSGAAELSIDDKKVRRKYLVSDGEGKPDVVALNDLRMWVIQRGERTAIRMRDYNASRYREYAGLTFFPPGAKYRVKGTFVPHAEPKMVTVPTAVGTPQELKSPGIVHFDRGEVREDQADEDYPHVHVEPYRRAGRHRGAVADDSTAELCEAPGKAVVEDNRY